jgi:hypothetical protein
VFKTKSWSGLNGDSYFEEENIAVVFVAFCGTVGLVSPRAEHNRARIGGDIGGGIDDSGNCAYYDGRWGTGWYSFCHSWIFADYKEYILVSAKWTSV